MNDVWNEILSLWNIYGDIEPQICRKIVDILTESPRSIYTTSTPTRINYKLIFFLFCLLINLLGFLFVKKSFSKLYYLLSSENVNRSPSECYPAEIRTPNLETPRRAKCAVNFLKYTIRNHRSEIKVLHQKCRRRDRKILNVKSVINDLKNYELLSSDTAKYLMVCIYKWEDLKFEAFLPLSLFLPFFSF